jgi:hypothetical protein
MKWPEASYANVASTLALFVAVSGASAYAANQLAERSVGEPQLRPGAVTAEKIRPNAITAPKIKAGAVKQGKLAGGSITAAKMTASAVATASLANGAVTNDKLAPGAVTGEKALESTFSQVPSAAKADSATVAESANPLAFAAVNADASLDPNLSKGIAAVSEGSLGGTYCITAAGFNPRGAQVTPRLAISGEISAYALIGGSADCPAPGVEVQTFDAGARTKEAFYVEFYR